MTIESNRTQMDLQAQFVENEARAYVKRQEVAGRLLVEEVRERSVRQAGALATECAELVGRLSQVDSAHGDGRQVLRELVARAREILRRHI